LHNPLLTIWAETGLFGLLLYSGILISSIFVFTTHFLRVARQQASPFTAAYGVIGVTVLAYLVSWFKGGGSESEFAFFLAIALLNLKVAFPLPVQSGHQKII
jgi:O-antigen ligase